MALLFRYALVGGCVGLLFLVAGHLLREAGWNFSSSVVLAYIMTTPLSYMGQRRLVFRSKGSVLGQATRYVLVCTAVGGASAAIQRFYSDAGVAAQMVVWALASTSNFIGYRFVVFTRDLSGGGTWRTKASS